MDDAVKAALSRWPDVPAAFGWLSLDGRGHWHLHPDGVAAQGGPGESITNTQIIAFIQRNFASDDTGRWFFQNGPQRAYVRVDAAPLILRRADAGDGLIAHTGQSIGAVSGWWLADGETLFAQTDLGPGVVEDRELPLLLERMTVPDGAALGDWLASRAEALDAALPQVVRLPGLGEAPLRAIAAEAVASELGFVANPEPAPAS